jgi:hypothetical protein
MVRRTGDRIGGMTDVGLRLEQTILELLATRARGATICPSDAARVVDPEGWRGLMDASRSAASRLVDRGLVEVTQGGSAVDLGTARGPIRIRRVP